jgi:hypothetical protein
MESLFKKPFSPPDQHPANSPGETIPGMSATRLGAWTDSERERERERERGNEEATDICLFLAVAAP